VVVVAGAVVVGAEVVVGALVVVAAWLVVVAAGWFDDAVVSVESLEHAAATRPTVMATRNIRLIVPSPGSMMQH
jgi:hypothetical protein